MEEHRLKWADQNAEKYILTCDSGSIWRLEGKKISASLISGLAYSLTLKPDTVVCSSEMWVGIQGLICVISQKTIIFTKYMNMKRILQVYPNYWL
jgi:hypothetical protein